MEIRIRSNEGDILAEGHRGNVEFRGPSSLNCYFQNEEATRKVKDDQGWVSTGDLGFIFEGELYITGRSKDLIILAGRNVQPEDVEDIAAKVKGVRKGCVAAFGLESELDGTENLIVVAETRLTDEDQRRCLLYTSPSPRD